MFEDLRTALSKRDKKPKEWRKFLQGEDREHGENERQRQLLEFTQEQTVLTENMMAPYSATAPPPQLQPIPALQSVSSWEQQYPSKTPATGISPPHPPD